MHPDDWTNPTPKGRYNLVVIGAGTACLIAAAGAAGLGARVALVERHMLGGDCLNFGCVPSKAMIRSGHAAAAVRDAGRFGVEVSGELPAVDFARVMERMRALRADLSHHDSAERFSELGVDVYIGDARFTSTDAVEVEDQTLTFARAIIATGARAVVPAIPGLSDVDFLTNKTVFSLTALPARLGVLGAGPIGCELAQTFARLGARVHLLEQAERVLPREDPEASALVHGALERDGVTVYVGHPLSEVRSDGDVKLLVSAGKGGTEEVAVDQLLLATGRRPNVEGLGLDATGVTTHPRGITLDDHLRTENPRVFAAGDVAQPFHFTHAADHSARIALRNALFMGRERLSGLVVPWATFTDPEVAHVGLTVSEMDARGLRYRTYTQTMDTVDRALIDGETEGFARVHVAANTDRILGATVVGKNAGSLISEVSAAIAGGLGLGQFTSIIHPYPTQADVFSKLANQVQRERLTPAVSKLMETWMSLTR